MDKKGEGGCREADEMNILMCGNSFGPKKGGSQTYAQEVASNLTAMGQTVVFLTRTQSGYEEFDAQLPFEVIRRKSKVDLGILFFKKLKTERYDAVFVTHRADFAALANTASRLLGKPYFISVYGGEILHDFRARSVKRNFASARAVIAISKYTKALLVSLGVSEKRIRIIPCGTDPQRFSPDISGSGVRQKFGIEDKKVILSVSRLVKRKGNANVISALPDILEEIPKAHYLIAGTGPEEGNLQAQVREMGLSEAVSFAGYVNETDLPSFYASCNVFVMPSFAAHRGENVEGFGIAYLEANACGKPVVGGRTGGVPDAIIDGETGLLVDPLDVRDIRKAIVRILGDDEKAREMGLAGRKRVETEYNWRSVSEKILDLIERLSK
jgi:phosphatidylinositol alpha-1,6-mannosyltransferase